MFTKKERSSFKYWFAHWCAYQMTALNLKCWKPYMLLHDWYKPWMKLFCDYSKVKKYHREHSPHHIEHLAYCNYDPEEMDWLGMVIDWECSRFTKQEAPLNAFDTYLKLLEKYKPEEEPEYMSSEYWYLKSYIPEILMKLDLVPNQYLSDPQFYDIELKRHLIYKYIEDNCTIHLSQLVSKEKQLNNSVLTEFGFKGTTRYAFICDSDSSYKYIEDLNNIEVCVIEHILKEAKENGKIL